MVDYIVEIRLSDSRDTVRLLLKGEGCEVKMHDSALRRAYSAVKGQVIYEIKLYECRNNICEEVDGYGGAGQQRS